VLVISLQSAEWVLNLSLFLWLHNYPDSIVECDNKVTSPYIETRWGFLVRPRRRIVIVKYLTYYSINRQEELGNPNENYVLLWQGNVVSQQ